jgi:hypothetical protein
MVASTRYLQGSRSAAELASILDDLRSQVPGDGELVEEIRRCGVEPSALTPDAIRIGQADAGLDPAAVTLVVTFAAPPFLDVWKHVLLPRIRRRWGIDVVGPEREGNGSPGPA